MKCLHKVFISILLFSLTAAQVFSQNANIGGFTYGHNAPKTPVIEKKGGTLRITSSPTGSSVYLDGSYKGTTPLTIENIKGGYHTLKVEKKHYRGESRSIYISENSKRNYHARLEQISGYLRVYSEPSGASLSINGNSYSQGSLVELDEGHYTIRAKRFGYEEKSQTIYVPRLRTITQTICMNRAEFRLESISVSRKKFNPQAQASLASIKLTAKVNAPETGILSVKDSSGSEVFSSPVSFTTWTEQFYWTGTDSFGNLVQDGRYTIEILAGGQRASCMVEVDSSLVYPDLSLTNGGSGIGTVASAENYPEGSAIVELGAGIIMGDDYWKVYQVPLSMGFLWAPSDHLELGLAFSPYLNGEDSVINFSSSLKASFQTPLSDSTTFYWGFLGRLGFATGPLYLPYGIDAGNGAGLGLVLGFKFNSLYIGGESSMIFKPTGGIFNKGDDRIWKTGIAIQRQFESGSLGLFANVNIADGNYSFKEEHDGTDTTVTGSFDRQCVYEAVFEGSLYLSSSPIQFTFSGGTFIMPGNSGSMLIHPHAQLGLKMLF